MPNAILQEQNIDLFQATIRAPANTRSDGQSETYSVTIEATASGLTSQAAAGMFTVPPPSGPPGTPEEIPPPPSFNRRL